MKAEVNPFSNEALYIPLKFVTNVDPHELYLSRSKEELRRDSWATSC